MLTFDASEFFRATALLQRVQGVVQNIEKFNQQPENAVTEADGKTVPPF